MMIEIWRSRAEAEPSGDLLVYSTSLSSSTMGVLMVLHARLPDVDRLRRCATNGKFLGQIGYRRFRNSSEGIRRKSASTIYKRRSP